MLQAAPSLPQPAATTSTSSAAITPRPWPATTASAAAADTSAVVAPIAEANAVVAPLEFVVPRPGHKPRFISAALAGDGPQFLFEVAQHPVRIEDARAWPSAPTLAREGFALLHKPTAVADLEDDDAVTTRYLPEVQALIAEALGAEKVVAFDATRRSDASTGADNPDGARRPAGRVHVDYTEASGPRRAADVLGAERVAEALAAGKAIVQVNAWRPIRGPVMRSPLTLADASSIAPEQLIATEQVFPHRVGEIYSLAHAPGQRFAYVSAMTPDEVILIKGWDSRDDGRARFTPHSAFALPHQEQAPPRHSIEVRAFAILPASHSR